MDCPSAIPVKLPGTSTLLERVPVGADKSANCSLHEESVAAWKNEYCPFPTRNRVVLVISIDLGRRAMARHGHRTDWRQRPSHRRIEAANPGYLGRSSFR